MIQFNAGNAIKSFQIKNIYKLPQFLRVKKFLSPRPCKAEVVFNF